MTKSQLLRFVRIRNKSEFDSNLQFAFDASQAGFKASDLGDAHKLRYIVGYYWQTPHGILVERLSSLRLFAKATS